MEISDSAFIESVQPMTVRVLCVHKPFEESGGIGRFYGLLKNRFVNRVKHFEAGSRRNEHFLLMPFRFLFDYCKFIIHLRWESYDIVHINVSFNLKSIIRDGIFILLVPSKVKLIVHFHAWYSRFVEKLSDSSWYIIFKHVYGRADVFLVLVDKYREALKTLGFSQPVRIVPTAVDSTVVKDMSIRDQVLKRCETRPLNILFLARMIKEKGIYETIDGAVQAVSRYNLKLKLTIAGDGKELKPARLYASKLERFSIPYEFTGYAMGPKKYDLYSKASLYCLPSYNEGMPLSVLEAMIFGLPIIVSKVGQIPNVLNEMNGVLLNNISSEEVGKGIYKIASNTEYYKRVSINNHIIASTLFASDKVARSFDTIYYKLCL